MYTPTYIQVSEDETSSTTIKLDNAVGADNIFSTTNNNITVTPRAKPRWQKLFYKFLMISAVFLNPLFAIFLYVATSSVINNVLKELELESKFWDSFFIAFNIVISILSGISDIIVVNPIEESDIMLTTSENDPLSQKLSLTPAVERKIIQSFTGINQIIGNSTFLVGSASAALGVAYIVPSISTRWALGIPITALEIIYLNLLSKKKIDLHSYEFIHRLVDKQKSMMISAIKSPLKSLEVTIQVLINALNRAVVYGYIMEQILKEFLPDINHQISAGLIFYTAAASLYTALVSRTLNVHKQFFNEQFNDLSDELLKTTTVSRLGLINDISMSLLRAVAVSTLIYRHGPNDNTTNIVLSVYIGLQILSHGIYVRYTNRLYQTALDYKLKQTVMARAFDNIDTREILSPTKMFDIIKEKFVVNTTVKISTSIINVGSRLANWCSFLGFLITANKLLQESNYLKLDFYDLLCIQQLLCTPAVENELSFFQESMTDTIAYYCTKFYMERTRPYFGFISSLWQAKTAYQTDYLTHFLPRNSNIVYTDNGELIEVSAVSDDVTSPTDSTLHHQDGNEQNDSSSLAPNHQSSVRNLFGLLYTSRTTNRRCDTSVLAVATAAESLQVMEDLDSLSNR